MRKEMLAVVKENKVDVDEFFRAMPEDVQEHCKRVSALTAQIIGWVKESGACEGEPLPDAKTAQRAVLYHDIGKTLVPSRILERREELSAAERHVIERHAAYGAKLLERYRAEGNFSPGEEELWRMAAEVALSHHERWDGKGYPYGLLANTVPLLSRIVAVADTYDSIVHGGAHRVGLPEEYALLEVVANKGTQFDPCVVQVLRRHADALCEPESKLRAEAFKW